MPLENNITAPSYSTAYAISEDTKFPHRLFDLLSTTEGDMELNRIISWQPHGRCFKVHDSEKFSETIIFSSRGDKTKKPKFSSFLRNLNLWGFKRLHHGRDKGCYYHRFFIRGNRSLCSNIYRKAFNNEKKVRYRAPTAAEEPDFYAVQEKLSPKYDRHFHSNEKTIDESKENRKAVRFSLPQDKVYYSSTKRSQRPGNAPLSLTSPSSISTNEKSEYPNELDTQYMSDFSDIFDKENVLKTSQEFSPNYDGKEPADSGDRSTTPVSLSTDIFALSRECTECFGPEEVKTLLHVLEL